MRRRRNAGPLLSLMLMLLLAPSTASAQDATSGAIAGRVADTSGAVLPGVTVEASSPALIEKLRTVTTDARGEYKIVGLRPGVYAMTFTLAGFNVVRREGIELTTGFTATVNAGMSIGSLEETVTVTGASPVVDVQNVQNQAVYQRELLDTLPYSKSLFAFTNMTPGVTIDPTTGTTARDVGGSNGESPRGQIVHGSDLGLMSIEGIMVIDLKASPDVRRLNVSDLYTQEVVLGLGNGGPETWTGGPNINIIFKDGGNQFRGTSFVAYSGQGWDSNNLSDRLRARGVGTPSTQRKIYDYGVGFGGPIKSDRLWFYVSPRRWGNESLVSGNYYNATPHTLFYTPDLSRPAIFSRRQWDFSGRVTLQATPKQKWTVTSVNNYQCFCPFSVDNGTVSPEGAAIFEQSPQNLVPVTWTYTATDRLLLEAGGAWRRAGAVQRASEGSLLTDQPVQELSINRIYSGGWYGGRGYGTIPQQQKIFRGALSYVTGSHAFKTGFQVLSGYTKDILEPAIPVLYVFRNQIPVSLTQVAAPLRQEQRLNMLGLFVQDQWTLSRLTLNFGVRFDSMRSSSPRQSKPAGPFTPEFTFDAVDNIPNWKDVSPRLGVAYDLFGNGKTALKAAIGRYDLATNYGLNTARVISPAGAIVTSTGRIWNDANGNFAPDCDLTLKSANGECGAMLNQAFGTSRVTTRYADDVLKGWNVSPFVWQGSVSLQQELGPGISVTAGYYRTSYGNITLTDNQSVSAADFTPYCITAPVDSRLPGGGGQQVCGLYDVSREKLGQVDSLVELASKYGGNSRTFNGVDVTMNARLPRGVTLFGGISNGKTAFDTCNHPDTPNAQFCKTAVSWADQFQIKFSGVYPLPWWGIQASASIQNIPGRAQSASFVATNANIAPSLGRNLSSCPNAVGSCNATALVNLVDPNVLFESRGNQLDTRFSKVFRFSGGRKLQGNFDIYNLFNSSDVVTVQTRYSPATWLQPIAILQGRTLKVSMQVDF